MEKVKQVALRVLRRVVNEPALVVGVIVAVGNLVGTDTTEVENLVVSVLAIVGAVLVRQQVTPVRKLARDFGEGEV